MIIAARARGAARHDASKTRVAGDRCAGQTRALSGGTVFIPSANAARYPVQPMAIGATGAANAVIEGGRNPRFTG